MYPLELKLSLNVRKHTRLYAILALLATLVGWTPVNTNTAQAAIAKYLNFQGKLTKVSDGTNVANGSYAFEFKLYDASTSGTLLWTETYDQPSGACTKLVVTSGVFNAKLGSCNALTGVDFTSSSLYLSVNFAPTGTSYDGEMSPRKQLVSTAYAFIANGVSGDGPVNSTISSATALTVAKSGSNYGLQVDTSAASAATGLKITSGAATSGIALSAISSGTNENITVDAKGSGTVSLGATSTGDVLLGGGSGSTGCTITNSTGAFACAAGGSFTTLALTGTVTGAASYNGLVITANTGVITTGTWNGTAIGSQYGGTGQNFSASSGLPSINAGAWQANTITPNGVAYGGASNAMSFTAQGAANTVLVANAGAPSFSAAITVGTSVTSPTINATTALQFNGTNINTGGTLSNVAYLDQNNTFTGRNIFNPTVTANGGIGLSLAPTITNATGSATQYGGKLSVTSTGSTATTLYGQHISFTDATSTANNATGLYVDVTTANSADTTYAAVFQGGNVGVGDTSPTAALTVGSGDLFQVNSSGAIAAATGINSSGTINFSTLTASSAVYTDGSKNLTSTAPTSGVIGYWSRSGTTLSTTTAGDAVTTSGNISTSGSGTITSAGTLTASNGLALTTGALSLTGTSGSTAITGYGTTSITSTTTTGNINTLANSSLAPAAAATGYLLNLTLTNGSVNTTGTSTVAGINIAPTTTAAGTGGTMETYGIRIQNAAGTAGAGTQNIYGIRIGNQGAGTNTETTYGLYVDAQTGGATASYAAIFMGGNIGIGTATPDRPVHIYSASSGGAVIKVEEPNPRFDWLESDAAANNKLWRMQSQAEQWKISAISDDLSTTTDIITVDRTGASTIDQLQITNGNLAVGQVTASAKLHVLSTTEQLRLGYDTSNFITYTVSSAGALTQGLKANTANALRLTDSTNTYQTIDTRTTAANISANTFTTGTAPTIASAATAYFNSTTFTPGTVNFSGSTQITSTGTSANNAILFNQPTINRTAAATSLTIDQASNLFINGPTIASHATGGQTETITTSSALRIGAGSSLAGSNGVVTNGYGLYVDPPTGATNNYTAVFPTGRVGIGTASPSTRLHVAGLAADTSGTLMTISYPVSATLAGSLTGQNIDLASNVTATNQGTFGLQITNPGATNTGASTYIHRGIYASMGSNLTQSSGGGTSRYYALDTSLPAITQTSGTVSAAALNIATNNITTGGTMQGININATGVGAGTLTGMNFSAITGGAGTENAITIGSGWDNQISGNGWSVNGSGALTVASCSGCGGGATAFDAIGDPSGNGAINMGTTTQTLDWSATTTTDNLTVTSSATGLTSGSAFKVTSATTGAVTNGIVQLTASGAYTGSGGLLNITGNATTGGVIENVSGTGITTGTITNITAGTGITSGAALKVSASGTSAIANGLVQISHSGAYTSTGGLLNVTSSASTAGTLVNLTNNTASFTGTALNISTTGITSGTGIQVTGGSSMAGGQLMGLVMGTASTGTALNITANGGAYTGTGLLAFNSNSLTSGTMLSIAANGASQTSAKYIDIAQTGTTTGFTGNLINLSSTSTTGAATFINLTANSSTVGVGQAISMTGLTTGSALTITGPSSTGVTGSGILKVTSDVGSGGSQGMLAAFNPDYSSASAASGYGVAIQGTDSTAVANTNNNLYSNLALTGNAAKTGYASYNNVSSNSTTADTTYGGLFSTNITGAISTGTRNTYGFLAQPATSGANTGGTTQVFGGYFAPNSTGSTTGSTVNVFGNYISNTATLTTGGTINSYGLYVANGSMNTTGTSAQYGLYVAPQSGADANYAAYLGGSVGIGSSGVATPKQVNGLQLQYSDTSGSEYGIITSRKNNHLASNAYYAGGSTWSYIGAEKASLVDALSNGSIILYNTDTTGSADGTITWVDRFHVNANGYVGVNEASPSKGRFTVSEADATNDEVVYIDTEESTTTQTVFAIESDATTADTVKFKVTADGETSVLLNGQGGNNLCQNGLFAGGVGKIGDCTSDRRLKTNIVDLDSGALEKIMQVKPRVFDWINGAGQHQSGFIAQEVQAVIPELYRGETADGYLRFSKDLLVPYLTKALQELNQISIKTNTDGAISRDSFIFEMPESEANAAQIGNTGTESVATTGFVINQKGSANIIQLQQSGIDRLLITNDGSLHISTNLAAGFVLEVKNADTTLLVINTKGTAVLTGTLVVKKDIAVLGTVLGSTSVIAKNTSNSPIRQGDVVYLTGAVEAIFGDQPTITVAAATEFEKDKTIVGIADRNLSDFNLDESAAVSTDPTTINPGEYLNVIITGTFKKVSVTAGNINTGDKLTLSTTAGSLRKLNTGEALPAIGVALDNLTNSTGSVRILLVPTTTTTSIQNIISAPAPAATPPTDGTPPTTESEEGTITPEPIVDDTTSPTPLP